MKKTCLILMCALLMGVAAHAQLNVIIKGDSLSIDASGFPSDMQVAYHLMMAKCNQCHTIERIVVAVQSEVCPLSKSAFTKETVKAVVTRMFLKENSNMTRDDARVILGFLKFLLDQKTTVLEKIDNKPDAVWQGYSSGK
jgi:hypothetical protein